MELATQAQAEADTLDYTAVQACINCFPDTQQSDRDFNEIQSRLAVDSAK
jgi:hypothetical protein